MMIGTSQAEAERLMRANVEIPDHLYPITSVSFTEDRRPWLRREYGGNPVRRWTVVDTDGTPLGEVRLPSTTSVEAVAGDAVWVVERGAFDVPFVVRYRVVRTP